MLDWILDDFFLLKLLDVFFGGGGGRVCLKKHMSPDFFQNGSLLGGGEFGAKIFLKLFCGGRSKVGVFFLMGVIMVGFSQWVGV